MVRRRAAWTVAFVTVGAGVLIALPEWATGPDAALFGVHAPGCAERNFSTLDGDDAQTTIRNTDLALEELANLPSLARDFLLRPTDDGQGLEFLARDPSNPVRRVTAYYGEARYDSIGPGSPPPPFCDGPCESCYVRTTFRPSALDQIRLWISNRRRPSAISDPWHMVVIHGERRLHHQTEIKRIVRGRNHPMSGDVE